MTDEPEKDDDGLTVREARRQIVEFFRTMTAIIAGLSAMFGGLWYVFGDHLGAIAELPETNAAIQAKLSAIQSDLDAIRAAQNSRVRPVVEFHGRPHVAPMMVRAGKRTFATYNLRRNESCSGTLIRRWWDADAGVYDPQHESQGAVQRAPVTHIFQLWKLPLDIPANMAPGEWAYHPELIPGPDCVSDLPVNIPPAYFTVLPGE